ncbi:MAG: hypothetical protein R3C05_10475 [Pirellulaceae bacterium]
MKSLVLREPTSISFILMMACNGWSIFQQGLLNSSNTSISSTTLTQDWNLDQVGNWDGFDQGVSDPLNQTRTHNRVNEITVSATLLASRSG